VPEREPLRLTARRLFVRGLRQLDFARRTLDLLSAASLRALPLKGAAVAERLYDSAAERPMTDVDVLVLDAPEAALALLQAEGLALVECADHAAALRSPEGAVVELHRSLTACPGLFPVAPSGLWERATPGGSGTGRALSSADLLVSLALHASFHSGFGLRLVQFLDVKRLLEREAPDREAVLRAAAEARAEAPLLAALRAAEAVVDARPARDLLAALESRVDAFARHYARRLADGDPLSLVSPARPSLALARLALAGNRRGELLRQTLAPRGFDGGAPGHSGRTLWTGARRVLRLARQELARP
jgi:hypothetical protein